MSSNNSNNNNNNNDRRLVSKLLITYFEGKTSKREVLEVLSRILNFSEKEKQQACVLNQRGKCNK